MTKLNIIKGDIIYNISSNEQVTVKDGFIIFVLVKLFCYTLFEKIFNQI